MCASLRSCRAAQCYPKASVDSLLVAVFTWKIFLPTRVCFSFFSRGFKIHAPVVNGLRRGITSMLFSTVKYCTHSQRDVAFLVKQEEFDYTRLMKLASFGALVHGSTGHFFYNFLDAKLPGATVMTVVKKVFTDQVCVLSVNSHSLPSLFFLALTFCSETYTDLRCFLELGSRHQRREGGAVRCISLRCHGIFTSARCFSVGKRVFLVSWMPRLSSSQRHFTPRLHLPLAGPLEPYLWMHVLRLHGSGGWLGPCRYLGQN